ncbi:hypothetical protein Q5H93_14825 [Hymenobacter sp. ASUV-10]|uniref:Uncharacterized protein n=1 Tax=Hymenobacter aranciens TaxID=3063996 RepID=A0ABT9BCM0_9BACT|nr:hypothetical protein [Hymenobacter sp. ASUV-10]MDO7876015.1 hypothetical protein [Hymenobacter sp. ASUV-10]
MPAPSFPSTPTLPAGADACLARHARPHRWAAPGCHAPEAHERGPPATGTVPITSPVV